MILDSWWGCNYSEAFLVQTPPAKLPNPIWREKVPQTSWSGSLSERDSCRFMVRLTPQSINWDKSPCFQFVPIPTISIAIISQPYTLKRKKVKTFMQVSRKKLTIPLNKRYWSPTGDWDPKAGNKEESNMVGKFAPGLSNEPGEQHRILHCQQFVHWKYILWGIEYRIEYMVIYGWLIHKSNRLSNQKWMKFYWLYWNRTISWSHIANNEK